MVIAMVDSLKQMSVKNVNRVGWGCQGLQAALCALPAIPTAAPYQPFIGTLVFLLIAFTH
jgi:hypothetical protein